MEYFDREIEQAVVGSLVLWFPELKARIPEISTEDFHFEDIKGIFNRLHGLMDITPMDSTLILSCIVFLLILTSQISSSRRKKQMDICLLPLRRSKNLGRKENSFIMTASDRRLFSR